MHLDAHQKPSPDIKAIYKKYQKSSLTALHEDEHVVDFERGLTKTQRGEFERVEWHTQEKLQKIYQGFQRTGFGSSEDDISTSRFGEYACRSLQISGLLIVPGAIPLTIQKTLLDRVFHRDLSSALHRTNVDLHYDVQRPAGDDSFFSLDPASHDTIVPRDPKVHKKMTLGKYLTKSLRWLTLGGQYDWTNKIYPDEETPAFPEDIKDLLCGLFPETEAQAAIVNLYSPGDTLSLHRDVSEESERGLVSLSIGCDCIFMLGIEDEVAKGTAKQLVIRLRSGDVIYMSGKSRYAWHGVPLIVPNTCPDEVKSWPAGSSSTERRSVEPSFDQWSGWMASKRINLNVRQMKD